jgi:hypothetical protein
MVPVSMLKNPISTSISMPAINLPIVVTGDISPYPTVVIVTMEKYMASRGNDSQEERIYRVSAITSAPVFYAYQQRCLLDHPESKL